MRGHDAEQADLTVQVGPGGEVPVGVRVAGPGWRLAAQLGPPGQLQPGGRRDRGLVRRRQALPSRDRMDRVLDAGHVGGAQGHVSVADLDHPPV